MATPSIKQRNDPMPETEHTSLRAYLIAQGLTAAQALAAIGAAAAGRTRAQVDAALRGWLKNLPK